MSQLVQELIDKIKTEGVHEAEERARDIELDAKKRAGHIIKQAQENAAKIVNEAEIECKKLRETTETALQQVCRDVILNLKKEIQRILDKVVAHDVHQTLTPEVLAKIIEEVIKDYIKQDSLADEVSVTVSQVDIEKMKAGFLEKLKKEVKKPITFRAGDDIQAGFTISFDKDKSCFDFTDASLVEFLSGYLNEEVSSLLDKSISS